MKSSHQIVAAILLGLWSGVSANPLMLLSGNANTGGGGADPLASIKTSMVSWYDFDADADDDHSNNNWTVTGTPTYSSGAIVLTQATNTLSAANSAGTLGYEFMPSGAPTSGTCAMWIKAQAGATNSEDALVGKQSTIKLEKFNSSVGWSGSIGSTDALGSNSSTPVTDQYYFIVLNYNHGTTTSGISVNNGTAVTASITYATFNQSMAMAGDYTIAWQAYWNRTLTSGELAALYAAGTSLTYSSLP